jgi:hypothetical protein
VLALRAGGVHPAAGDTGQLRRIVDQGESWLAAEAFLAVARRGAPDTAELATRWLASEEVWRRRAVARAVVHRLPRFALR